ncbi:MAG: ATP-binding protein [Vulcanimicrobiota bacterium]
MEETLELVVARAVGKGVDLHYWLDPRLPATVIGDVTRLRQILWNLVSNAIKFTESGEVRLELSLGRREDEVFTLEGRVIDSGIGMPAERLDRLFKPFSQVDSSTTRRYGGTGLGLATCKKLTNFMGGDVWAESELGVGSTFSFCVQMKVGSEAAPVCPRELRLLYVESRANRRRWMVRRLQDWGALVTACEDYSQVAETAGEYDAALFAVASPLEQFHAQTLARSLQPVPSIALMGEVACRSRGHGPFSDCLPELPRQSSLFQSLLKLLGGTASPTLTPAGRPVVLDPSLAQRYPLHM